MSSMDSSLRSLTATACAPALRLKSNGDEKLLMAHVRKRHEIHMNIGLNAILGALSQSRRCPSDCHPDELRSSP
jgi:hypothetical protein